MQKNIKANKAPVAAYYNLSSAKNLDNRGIKQSESQANLKQQQSPMVGKYVVPIAGNPNPKFKSQYSSPKIDKNKTPVIHYGNNSLQKERLKK